MKCWVLRRGSPRTLGSEACERRGRWVRRRLVPFSTAGLGVFSARDLRSYHFHKVVGWHRFPEFVQEGAVVDAKSRGDAFGQAFPVFAVVGIGPFVDGGHAALHF